MLRAHQDTFVQFLRNTDADVSPCAWFEASTITVLRAIDETLRQLPGFPHEEKALARLVRVLEPYRILNANLSIDRNYVDARSDQAVIVVDITNKKVVVDEMYHKMPFPPVSEYTWEQVNLDEDRREHHGITPDQDPVWEELKEPTKTFSFAPDEHMMLKEGLRRMLVGVERGEITDDMLTRSVRFMETLQEKLGWPDDGEE